MRSLTVSLALFLGASLVCAAEIGIVPLSAGRVYPNPWRADRHAQFSTIFDGLPTGSTVKLFTLSGQDVKILTTDATGRAVWDRTNRAGQPVASGIYLYTVTDGSSRTSVGKLAIIR